MKTIFTLLTSLFMSIAVFAAARPQSILTIKSADNADIRVVLDGRSFNPNDNSMMIRGIDDGYHTIKVFRQRRGGFFNMSGRGYEMVYNSAINIKRRTHLFITIERNGRISMQENKLRRDWDRQDRDWDNRRDDNDRTYDYDNGGQWGRHGDYDSHNGYARGMNDSEFRNVIAAIKKEWLETNKMKSASQVVKSNSLTAAQVEQMLLLFNFENNKLQLAKEAYANTVDKQNYDMLMDVFSYNSSKAELERFIRGYDRY